jgi:hypothetical protein
MLPRVTLPRIIGGIAVLATTYVVVGVFLGSTDGSWKATDWYSMIAGVLFFGVGAGLAVAHEHQQERTAQILVNQNLLLDKYHATLDDQGTALRAVNTTMTAIKEEMTIRVQHVPSVEAVDPSSTAEWPETEAPQPPGEAEEDAGRALEGLTLSDGTPEERMLLERFALERAVVGAREGGAAIRELLKPAMVYVLGKPAGNTSVPGQGTESNILHFRIDDDDGKEQMLAPIFTRADVLRNALMRNPDWQTLAVLEVNGGDLLENLDGDVILVIDPWSRFEFRLLPDAAKGSSANADGTERDH